MVSGLGVKKQQSAMEYLMTYSWAILIIIVAVAALFLSGIFSASSGSRMAPGSCTVFRPYGPSSISGISLHGACLNGFPQYVSSLSGQYSYANYNGVVTHVSTTYNTTTIVAWVKPTAAFNPLVTNTIVSIGYKVGSSGDIELDLNGNGTNEADLFKNTYGIGTVSCTAESSANSVATPNRWYFIAGVETSSNVILYINGTENIGEGASCTTLNFGLSSVDQNPTTYIGAYTDGSTQLCKCQIADVQVYNTSLSANNILTLYHEGIGGVPIDLNHLTAWWPLNGDTNDYSGDGYNATASNVLYNLNWTDGYRAP